MKLHEKKISEILTAHSFTYRELIKPWAIAIMKHLAENQMKSWKTGMLPTDAATIFNFLKDRFEIKEEDLK